ncbi:SUEL-type lectin domain-containing protein [Trichonephila inaurata madagascariensis]|uniref:SUEL-type lectin domain-containing protein n=1 Tax=Trichonephila inaurata madagascariensis TaxID=2747483 RepID=A0A8X6XAR7_9ARAC|nr:SUEL-type lectin domain-containing protein [Trichonephila inaurata madagascariensis]
MKADENVVHQKVRYKLVITLNAFDTVFLFPCDQGDTLSLTAERTCSSNHIHITAAVSDTVKTVGRREKKEKCITISRAAQLCFHGEINYSYIMQICTNQMVPWPHTPRGEEFVVYVSWPFDKSTLLTGTLRTFQVHACDGNELQIECWPNTVINIYLAQYGRQVPSHQLCPPEGVTDGDLSMLNDTTNCLSTHALRTVEESCRDQRICNVKTSPQTFGYDPCPGVRKYAEVAYKCRPNMFSNKVVCEGDRLRLRCHRNLRIVIYSAAFGATHYGVPECPQPEGEGRIEGKFRTRNCYSWYSCF